MLSAVLVLIPKMFPPTPLDKIVIVVQALFLHNATLVGRYDPVYHRRIADLRLEGPLASFTLGFALLYGLLVDAFSMLFKAKADNGSVHARKLVAAVSVATAITRMASYYTTVYVVSLLPRNIPLEAAIVLIGGSQRPSRRL